MAAAAAGIFNHQMTAGQALTGKVVTPMESSTTGTSGTSSSSDSSGDSATISANDFLTLLVTEMQNQDPTADTDPNEYIDQLVEVNSLEQLIDINQTLSTDLGSSSTSSSAGATTQAAQSTPGLTGTNLTGAGANSATAATHAATHRAGALSSAQSGTTAGSTATAQSPAAGHAPGNLSVPRTSAAAQRVAHALDGRTRAQPSASSLSAAQ
jgi:flagellar basal-body rod modification protein FlgD